MGQAVANQIDIAVLAEKVECIDGEMETFSKRVEELASYVLSVERAQFEQRDILVRLEEHQKSSWREIQRFLSDGTSRCVERGAYIYELRKELQEAKDEIRDLKAYNEKQKPTLTIIKVVGGILASVNVAVISALTIKLIGLFQKIPAVG